MDECYKTLISIARKANNAGLVARTYDKYIVWTDSVKALTAQDELNILKKKYDESLTTIQEKDDSLSRQTVHYYRTLRIGSHLSGSISNRSNRIIAFYHADAQAKKGDCHCQ